MNPRDNGFGNIVTFLQNCWRVGNFGEAQKIYNALSRKSAEGLQSLPSAVFKEVEKYVQFATTEQEALWPYRWAARRTED